MKVSEVKPTEEESSLGEVTLKQPCFVIEHITINTNTRVHRQVSPFDLEARLSE
jgi:DNA-binding GntR family transcriptional regulator